MDRIIEPKLLKGFRDFLPEQELPRRGILAKLEKTMRSFGYVPIDTPILEYAEVLLGKGGGETDKQVYRFADNGGRDIAMRFDLTVPFARFMAAHAGEISLPFKRYHFAKVFRGQNTQRGRYREFMQCDFDCVGADSVSADLEILLLMRAAFRAIGIDGVTIRISHRGIFNRFLARHELADKSVEILRTVDKLKKIGPEQTLEILTESAGPERARLILDFINPTGPNGTGTDSNLEVLAGIEELAGGPAEDSERLRAIIELACELGDADGFVIDPSITRGLDYYTGIVYETFLDRLPGIGSVCSGGRYNDLASLYTKQELPGVGSSIGIDRLIAALEELGNLNDDSPYSEVLVFCMDPALMGLYHRTAAQLRELGISVEVYPVDRKIPAQFAYAEKRRIPWGLFIGSREAAAGVLQLKNLATRESFEEPDAAAVAGRIRAGRTDLP